MFLKKIPDTNTGLKGLVKHCKSILIILTSLIFFITFPENSHGAIHYVSPTGNATWAQSTSISTPCSVSTAFSKAMAGDTVYFRGGTYTIGQSSYPNPTLYPANSGTKGNPITFIAYPNETPVIMGTITPKVTGTAGAGTNKTTLVDSTKDFIALGIRNWDILRTQNTTKGGAAVNGVTDSHTLVLMGTSHNTLNGFTEGDYYEIGKDSTMNMGLGPGSKNYIIFDGFRVQATNSADGASELGGIHIFSSSEPRKVGNQVRNCTFIGPEVKKIVHGDNSEFIRIEKQSNPLVKGNRIHRLRHMKEGVSDWSTHNTSSIKTYHSDHIIIENNEIHDTNLGIFLKSDADDSIVRYNFIHNNRAGILITPDMIAMNTDRLQIYHNVIANCSDQISNIGSLFGAGMGGNDSGTHGNDNVVYNNTFYKTNHRCDAVGHGPSESGHGFSFYNNIIIPLSDTYSLITTSLDANNLVRLKGADHNQWGATFKTIRISNYWQARNYTSLSAWKASTELESAVDVGCGSNRHPGCGDLSSDPKFANGSGKMNQLADFRLATNSPCKGAGRGGVDMGANIDLVGILPK